jgi:hypothetical protein
VRFDSNADHSDEVAPSLIFICLLLITLLGYALGCAT